MAEQEQTATETQAPATEAPGNIRADLLAGIEQIETAATTEAVVEPPAPAEVVETAPEPAAVEDDEPEAEDPALAKRLDTIQKAERRSREAIAKERQAFDQEKAERVSTADQIKEFEQLKARVRSNPVAVLRALGISDAELEFVSKQAWFQSEAARKDPKLAAQAAQASREREYSDELAATRRELNEMRTQIQEKEQTAIQEQRVSLYLDTVAKAAGDETPILKTLLTKNPETGRARLRQAAEFLLSETGEVPEPLEVVRALEEVERRELELRGIDLSAVKTATKTTTPPATEKKTATLTGDLSSTTTPRPPALSREEERAEVLRAIEAGSLE